MIDAIIVGVLCGASFMLGIAYATRQFQRQLDLLLGDDKLERGRSVRQRPVKSPYAGSNPAVPANIRKKKLEAD